MGCKAMRRLIATRTFDLVKVLAIYAALVAR